MNKKLEEAISKLKIMHDYKKQVYDMCEMKTKIVPELSDEERNAIETALKELERLQEENNKLEKANRTYINSIQSITPVLLEDYIEKDKIREILDKLNISDIEPWSIYKVKGEILFDLEKLLEGK